MNPLPPPHINTTASLVAVVSVIIGLLLGVFALPAAFISSAPLSSKAAGSTGEHHGPDTTYDTLTPVRIDNDYTVQITDKDTITNILKKGLVDQPSGVVVTLGVNSEHSDWLHLSIGKDSVCGGSGWEFIGIGDDGTITLKSLPQLLLPDVRYHDEAYCGDDMWVYHFIGNGMRLYQSTRDNNTTFVLGNTVEGVPLKQLPDTPITLGEPVPVPLNTDNSASSSRR